MTPREELDEAIRVLIDKQVALSDKAALKALGDELGLASMAAKEAMLNGLSYEKIRVKTEYDTFDNILCCATICVAETDLVTGAKFTIRLKEPGEKDSWLAICSIEDEARASYYAYYKYEDKASFPEAFAWCMIQLDEYIKEVKDSN